MKKNGNSNFSRYYKYIIAVVIILILLGTGVWYVKSHFSPLLSQKLKDLVIHSSDSLYQVRFSALSINPITGNITLDSLHLIPDTTIYNKLKQANQAPQDLFDVSMSKLKLHDAHPFSIVLKKKVKIKIIHSENPIIKIRHEELPTYDTAKTLESTLANLISGSLNAIQIGRIELSNIGLLYTNKSKPASGTTELKNLDLIVKALEIDSASLNDTTRFLFAKDFWFHLQDYSIPTSDSLYFLKVKDLSFSTLQKRATIKGMTLQPRLSEKNFDKQLKYRKDRFNIKVDRILINGLNPINVKKNRWKARSLEMESADLDVYLNRSFPLQPDKKLLPQLMMKKASISFLVDTVKLKGINIKYRELNPESGRIGQVSFENTRGSFYNLTNDSVAIAENNHCKADLKTLFMGKGATKVHFDFNLSDPNQRFSFSGHLSDLNAVALNQATRPLGLIRIKSGRIHQLDFNFSADDYQANGQVVLLYDRLSVNILSKNENSGALQKKGLVSLMANLLVLKNGNVDDPKAVSKADVVYVRDLQRSVFTFMWKSLFDGVKKIAGLSDKRQKVINDFKKGSDRRKERRKNR